jgi:CheY-like chemotaxis protein
VKAVSNSPVISPTTSAATISSPKVLCVDDDPDTLLSLRWFLVSEGFEVSTATHGADALVWAQERLPDLVIADYMMPGMTGIELCRRLRALRETARIPVILYTAMTNPTEPGICDRLLSKRAALDAFVDAIWELLSAPR